jgi:hypothetical protein
MDAMKESTTQLHTLIETTAQDSIREEAMKHLEAQVVQSWKKMLNELVVMVVCGQLVINKSISMVMDLKGSGGILTELSH